MDIADLYKADYTIPLAFDLAAQGLTEERDARLGLRDRIAHDKLLARIVGDIKALLSPDGTDIPEIDVNELWDDKLGTVAGGVNWAGTEEIPDDPLYAEFNQASMGDDHIAVIGPEFDTPPHRGNETGDT